MSHVGAYAVQLYPIDLPELNNDTGYNKSINWNKRGRFYQVIFYRVYGAIFNRPRCSFAPVMQAFGGAKLIVERNSKKREK